MRIGILLALRSSKLKKNHTKHHILKEKQHSQNLLDYGDFFHITSQHSVELGCYGTLWEVPLWVGPGDKCGGNPHEIIIKSHKDIMGRTSIVFAFSLLSMLYNGDSMNLGGSESLKDL